MGSGSSRMASSRPPRPRSDHRPKLNLATFLCGGGASTSAAPPQIEDQLLDKLVLPTRLHGSLVDNDLQCTVEESPLTFSSESGSSSSMNEHVRSGTCINNGIKESSTPSQNSETSDSGKGFSESKELVPRLSSTGSGLYRTHSKRTRNLASTSAKPAHLEPSSTNADTTGVPIVEPFDSINDPVSLLSPVRVSDGVSPLGPGDISANGNLTTEIHGTGSTLGPSTSVLSSGPNLLEEEPLLGAATSSADLLTVGERRHGSVLHVDVVSISSNITPTGTRDISSNEARRNSRRLFLDAFSRRSTRRNHDSSAIVSSSEDNDDLGSHDRLLLDISDDLFGSRFDHDSVYLHRRSHGSNGRRWHSRSEMRERLRVGFDNDRRETTFCPSGLHPNGSCSCDSLFMHEESSTRASISRIVLLAEALFEVLDEIHRQPVSLSFSLPAPESVVNSLPVKSHIKHGAAGTVDDVEQCYICLDEYEEGDKIRVLPCCHEYHMSCVDKWLKEIHGVCPLCRGDVCEGTAESIAEVTA